MAYAERSFEIEGLQAHFLEGGSGYPLLLIHGSGPGASTIGNWRRVLDPLAEHFHVHAMDLLGFGKSSRKPEPPFFDPDLWVRQCRALLGLIPGPRVGVLAHSLSAVLAFRLAATEPRIANVLTTAAMGAPFKVNAATAQIWTFPATRDALRSTAELLVYDKSIIDDAYLDARVEVLHRDESYGRYFSSMFAGDKQAFADATVLGRDELACVRCAVTMLHGRNDVPFPPAISLALAEQLPQADVMLIARCSHSVAMEHPDKLLSAASAIFK